MSEIFLIILQLLFIIFIFNFSTYEITKKLEIKNFNIFEIMSVNIILFLNLLLFLSLLNITLNYIFIIIILITLLGFIKNFKSKFLELNVNKIFIISLLLLSFVISIDLASTIDLGWDAKIFGFFKTLNFYQNNNVINLVNLNVRDYPHLGSLLWSLHWKFPFNYNEYFGRISYIVIYLISIFTFYFDLKITKITKLIIIFLTVLLTYEYSLISGLQEILIFSLILMATKFAFILFYEKSNINQSKLIFYILLITNAACWIKNEGLIFMLIFNFSLLFIHIKNKLKIQLIVGSVLIFIIRAFYLYYLQIDFESSQFQSTFMLSNFDSFQIMKDIKIIIFYMIVYFIEIPIYLFFVVMVFWMLINKKRDSDFYKFFIIFGILNFLFIIFSFLFNMNDVEWQVRVGLKRVMFETAGFYLLPILIAVRGKK
tara:strand:- start:3570 stop:4853 length:1284 start_codon:yes stop_codon:yes gene_type:complete